jgi:Saxitoxin biosynthesis operon protein SxtJ
MAAKDRTGLTAATVKPTVEELRHFGFMLGGLIVVVFAGIPFLRRHVIVVWPWLAAMMLWLPALIAPGALTYPHRGWTRVGEALGWLNARLILSLLYLIAVVPIGLVMRLAGRDPMQRKFDSTARTYRVASKQRRSSHLEQPY